MKTQPIWKQVLGSLQEGKLVMHKEAKKLMGETDTFYVIDRTVIGDKGMINTLYYFPKNVFTKLVKEGHINTSKTRRIRVSMRDAYIYGGTNLTPEVAKKVEESMR